MMSNLSPSQQRAAELLAEEYERGGCEGPYPSYAFLARERRGDFTLCALRAIERALDETSPTSPSEESFELPTRADYVPTEDFQRLTSDDRGRIPSRPSNQHSCGAHEIKSRYFNEAQECDYCDKCGQPWEEASSTSPSEDPSPTAAALELPMSEQDYAQWEATQQPDYLAPAEAKRLGLEHLLPDSAKTANYLRQSEQVGASGAQLAAGLDANPEHWLHDVYVGPPIAPGDLCQEITSETPLTPAARRSPRLVLQSLQVVHDDVHVVGTLHAPDGSTQPVDFWVDRATFEKLSAAAK